MKPKLIYVYDALCSWCYGFSKVMQSIHASYADRLDFEVISGGMILNERIAPLASFAPVIRNNYKTIEAVTGITFGEGFLKHLYVGSAIMESETPAIALSVFKSYQPEKALEFAHSLQNALYFDGKGPQDEDMYRYLAVNYNIDPDEFLKLMNDEVYKQAAYYDFALAKQLNVEGYPAVFVQSADNYFYLVAKGYTNLKTMELRLASVFEEKDKA